MGVSVEFFGEVRPSAAAIAAAKSDVQARANVKAARRPADSKLVSLAVEYANSAGEKTMVVTATPQRWRTMLLRRKGDQTA
jgi:hypothetical protein